MTTDALRKLSGTNNSDTNSFDIEWKVQLIDRLDRIAEALEHFSSMIDDCLSAEGDAIDVRVNSDAF